MSRASILDYFLDNAKNYEHQTAAQVKRDGRYCDVSWGELARDALSIASKLIALDVQPGERICLISQTRLEWVIAYMGILVAGCVTVPIYPSNLPDECQYIAENSGAVIIIAEDATQVQKFRAERSRLPHVRMVIQITGAVQEQDGWVVCWSDFVSTSHDIKNLEKRRAGLHKDSILTIIYTSGTTGRPKGVVTTHDAMLYEAEAVRHIDLIRESDVQLLFLPLAHVFAKALEIAWLATRHVMAFAEGINTIKDNLQEVRPTLMAGVPRIYEKFHAAIVKKATEKSGLSHHLFLKAAELSMENGVAELNGRPMPLGKRLAFAALKRVVFTKIGQGLSQTLGGRMRLMVSGGAPLSPQIACFFRDAGIEILEGFGLTETSAATTLNRPGRNRIGTVGLPVPGTEVRLAEDGEVMVRGRGVMREYWNNAAATQEVLRDGWFYTGDIGVFESDGTLRIVDRKKDIIVTAGGKNIAPQNLENMLKTEKLISQVVVYGDKRPYLSALITLDAEALTVFAKEHQLSDRSYAELTKHPRVYEAVSRVVDALNKRLPSYETIKKFSILEHDFSQETGELTPSLKIKRKMINQRYKDVLERMYLGEAA